MTGITTRYDLVTIGAGTGGLTVSRLMARAGRKVALIDSARPGGDCLWTGCVPTKALIEAAQRLHDARDGARFGVLIDGARLDFAAVRRHVADAQAKAGAIDSPEAIAGLGIELIPGQARFVDHRTVAVGERQISAKHFVIATGAEPWAPSIPGLAEAGFDTSAELLGRETLPASLAIIGAGPIGVEFAQMMNRFGVAVTLLESAPQVLPAEDAEAAATISRVLAAEGITVRTGARILRVANGTTGKLIRLEYDGETRMVEAERLLVATGRRPRVAGLDVEAASVALSGGRIVVDAQLRTSQGHIFAVGDVVSRYQFTHVAEAQARMVANILQGKRFQKWSDRVVPRVTFTDPEVAAVGLTEAEAATARLRRLRAWKVPLTSVDRAIVMGRTHGFVKVLTAAGWNRFVPGLGKLMGDEIVGACIVAPHAGDLLMPLVMAMRARLPVGLVAWNMQAYPTLALGVRQAAGLPFDS